MFLINLERAEAKCCFQDLTRISQIMLQPGKGRGGKNHHRGINANVDELSIAGYFLLTPFRHMKINKSFMGLGFCCAWRLLRLWAQPSTPFWEVSLVLHATLLAAYIKCVRVTQIQGIFHTDSIIIVKTNRLCEVHGSQQEIILHHPFRLRAPKSFAVLHNSESIKKK